MIVTHQLTMELSRSRPLEPLCVMQDDRYSRDVSILLTLDDDPWPIPDGTAAVIHFEKSDGTGGNYDALPDGTAAYAFSGNVLNICLAPQVCTVPGAVKLTVTLTLGKKVISTFAFYLAVQRAIGLEAKSENYFKVAGALADSGWEPDMYLGTDEEGRVVVKEMETGGIGDTEKNLILALFQAAVYTRDMSACIADLEALWAVHFTVINNLTDIATNNGSSMVIAGRSYSAILSADTGFSLTGATVKVTMGGVDITSEAYSGGVITIAEVTGNIVITAVAAEIPSYTITNHLTGVTTDNSAARVSEGDFYSATLSWEDGYSLNSIVITMGGLDVTADVYGEGAILITEVTGDVVITAVAELIGLHPVYELAEATTFDGTANIDTGVTLALAASDWSIIADVSQATGGTLFGTHGANSSQSLCVKNHGDGWGVYACYGNTSTKFKTGSAFKFVITHETGKSNVTVHNVQSGELVSADTQSQYWSNANKTPSTLKLGSDYTGSGLFKGVVDGFAIYERRWALDEIKEYLGVE